MKLGFKYTRRKPDYVAARKSVTSIKSTYVPARALKNRTAKIGIYMYVYIYLIALLELRGCNFAEGKSILLEHLKERTGHPTQSPSGVTLIVFAIDPALSGCISRASDISLFFLSLVATSVEVVPRRQYFARMIGQKAASSGPGARGERGCMHAAREEDRRERADAHSAASRPDTMGLDARGK